MSAHSTPQLEGPLQHELVALRLPGSVNHVPSVKRTSRSSCCSRAAAIAASITVSAALVARERQRPAARGQHTDARRLVVDVRQRLAQERLGLVAGQAQPPARLLERERGPHEQVTAGARRAIVGGFQQVAERLLGVAGGQLGLGDAERAARPAPTGLGHERQHAQQQLGGVLERE